MVDVKLFIYRFAYAPYGVLKKMGVKGPAPRPFWGNAKEFVKVSPLRLIPGRTIHIATAEAV